MKMINKFNFWSKLLGQVLFAYLFLNIRAFPCAPENITSGDNYNDWTDVQKLQFGVCYETNESIIEDILNKTVQMEHGEECSELDPTWEKIRPGINNVDYYDEFHTEIPIPEDLIIEWDPPVLEFPRNARILTQRGFDHVYKLLTTDNPICDTISPSHMPMECRGGFCDCKVFYPGFGNDYTVHFTEFRDRRILPIALFFNADTKKCTFPLTNECKVQPNEDHPGGYMIPCANELTDKCLIKGNNFPCSRDNVMKTLELYNIRAHNAKERYVPFRLHFPIPCNCTSQPEKLEGDKWPEAGLEEDFITMIHDEDQISGGATLQLTKAGIMFCLVRSFIF